MAEGKVCSVNTAPTLVNNMVERVSFCACCITLKSELDGLRSEVESYKEIIRILYEDSQTSETTPRAADYTPYSGRPKQTQERSSTRDEGWLYASDRRGKPQNARRQSHRIPLQLSNQFAPLHNLNEDAEGCRFRESVNNNKVWGDKMGKKDKQKIVIVGDSHARRCSAKLQQHLGERCSVTGHVMPGARMEHIVNSGLQEINNLTGDDVIVVWGGSNDISKQNSEEAVKHLCNFTKSHQDIKVIVVAAPQRHDLMPSSCVNSEVARFNRLVRKSMKLFTNTRFMDTNLHRDCFTNHGLHMNSLGKDQIIMNLAGIIDSVTAKESGPTIALQWSDKGLTIESIGMNQIQNHIQQVGDINQVAKQDIGEVAIHHLRERYSQNPALEDHNPRAPNDSTRNECCRQVEVEIDRQKNPDHNELTQPKPRIATTPTDQQVETLTNRMTNRNRRLPITRSSAFLW